MKREGELEIDEHLTFQGRQLLVQGVGMALTLAMIVGALLGVFGNGLLSGTTTIDATGSLTIEYERFVRAYAGTEITVTYAHTQENADSKTGEIEVLIGAEYLERFDVESLVPEPMETVWSGNGVTFVFEVERETAPLQVNLMLMPQAVGRASGEVTIRDEDDDVHVTFEQFSYP